MAHGSSEQPVSDASVNDPRQPRPGRLVLEDGTEFMGRMFGRIDSSDGEVVFNTGMVGYVESLTDPSYRGQILVLTYPLIGNYGVPGPGEGFERFESDGIQVKGLVVAGYVDEHSHWESAGSLDGWLMDEGVPALTGIDTRELTKVLRSRGTMLGWIVPGDGSAPAPRPLDPNSYDIVSEVSCNDVEHIRSDSEGAPHILVVDCGCKKSIVRELSTRGCSITVVPYDHDIASIECDGIMISNGPGDPSKCKTTIENLSMVMSSPNPPPVSGICLGCQIIALSAGASTFKLPFGHRSQNQPCRLNGTEKLVITSQNHGYAIEPASLPDGWEEWISNLNDGTLEGIRHREKPFFAVQFHPEARPGPTDSLGFFDEFLEVVRND